MKNARGARRGQPAEPLSFGDLIDNRHEWLYENLPPASAKYLHNLHAKQQQKSLAQQLGLSVAKEYLMNVPLAEAIQYIERTRLDRLVIKPNSSHSAIGCRCVVRNGQDYLDLRKGKTYRLQELERELAEEYGGLNRPDEWLVEELLMPADGSIDLIEDYKLYCFAGRVELILNKKQKLIAGKKECRVQWYTRDWKPVDVGQASDLLDSSLEVPDHASQLVAIAKSTSARLCYPFIRIDLYDTTRGIVLGEFTPGPGRRHEWNAEWNERLVAWWFEAARTLEDRLRSGKVQPLYPKAEGVQVHQPLTSR
jgi:hypothetical protein